MSEPKTYEIEVARTNYYYVKVKLNDIEDRDEIENALFDLNLDKKGQLYDVETRQINSDSIMEVSNG